MCLAGASGAGAELLEALPRAGLRALYAWLPMMPSDHEDAARAVAERLTEARAAHYWDANRYLSRRMAKALKIDTRRAAAPHDDPAFAWDIYLAYRRGKADVWGPSFWMHQLAVDHAPRFDAREWRRRVEKLLMA